MEIQLWEDTRKNTVNKEKIVMEIEVIPFSIDKFLEIWYNPSYWYRIEDTQISGYFSYKCKHFLEKANSYLFFKFFMSVIS